MLYCIAESGSSPRHGKHSQTWCPEPSTAIGLFFALVVETYWYYPYSSWTLVVALPLTIISKWRLAKILERNKGGCKLTKRSSIPSGATSCETTDTYYDLQWYHRIPRSRVALLQTRKRRRNTKPLQQLFPAVHIMMSAGSSSWFLDVPSGEWGRLDLYDRPL